MFTRIFIVSLLLLALSGCAPAPAAPPATAPPTSPPQAAVAATPTATAAVTSTPQPTPTRAPAKPSPLTRNNLNSVWGSSGTDVFAVGESGTILHYDGTVWSPMDSGSYNFLTTVWGSSDRDVFAVGWGGTILHYDGNSWTHMNSGTFKSLWGIWGTSGDDVFAFGDGGTILHYDGNTWSPMDSGTSNTLSTGWGSSSRDIFAVGWGGTILHYDGVAWSPMDSGTHSYLWGVWGSSGNDVFVAGEAPGGTILHYDGNAWSPMDSGTSKGIWGVWAGSEYDVFIVGELGTILHYDGSNWSSMDSGTDVQELTTVWGGSGRDVFAVGYYGTILHYDGSAWSDMSRGAPADASGATASSPSPTTSLDSALVSKIEAAITQTMKRHQIPGLAIGIIKDGQVAYTKGFGLAEVETNRTVTPETVFQLGSDSKMMVGIAIMQLKEQGKIDLDAPVTTYLPYFQLADERYKDISIRQILSHRSGLPYNTGPGYYIYSSDYQSPEYDEESLERHVRNLPQFKLYFAPGKSMQYSDLGYEILGDVIAKVSGQSFEAYTQEHIFIPLGMKHTSFMVRDIPPELLAAPHVSGPKVNSYFPYSRQHAPSSHLFSNVDNMLEYALAQLNQGQLGEMKILPAAAYEEMWAPQGDTNLPSPWERKVGLGWFLGGQEGHRLVGHGGADIGFGCGFIMAPDDGLAVVVMVNREYAAENFSYEVMESLLEAEAKP
jgi:CubicO group peptidase (beta-lactamase class C family)